MKHTKRLQWKTTDVEVVTPSLRVSPRKTCNCSFRRVRATADRDVVVDHVNVVVQEVTVAMTTVLPKLKLNCDEGLRDGVVGRGRHIAALNDCLLARDI